MKRHEMIGKKFGRLLVLEIDELESEKPRGKRNRKILHYRCLCDCGNITIVNGGCLRKGRVVSCGCHRKEKAKESMTKLSHEQWQDEEYRKMQSEKMKDKWQNEEYREKMRESVERQWADPSFRMFMREKAWNQWENEEFRKMQKEKPVLKGKEHYRYNHDLTEEDRMGRRLQEGYNDWSKQVKEKNNYTCQRCGQIGGKLCSHHLDGYNWCKEKRLDINNGVCLCEKCHNEFHKIYGKGDNTKEQYMEFIDRFEIIEE